MRLRGSTALRTGPHRGTGHTCATGLPRRGAEACAPPRASDLRGTAG